MSSILILAGLLSSTNPIFDQSVFSQAADSPKQEVDHSALSDPRPAQLAALIFFTLDPEMFPRNWNATAEIVSSKDVRFAREVILRAMTKYPEHVVRDNLQRVYVVRSLSIADLKIGGTHSGNRVYIVLNDWEEQEYAYMEESFHHEFSGLLKWRHREHFSEADWKNVNPSFSYFGSPYDAIRENRAGDRRRVRSLMQLGFVIEYGKTDLENDFNTIASDLFLNRRGFWTAVKESPLLAAKVDLAIQFYSCIDPSFDEQYFRNLPSIGEPVVDDNLGDIEVDPNEVDAKPAKKIGLYSNDEISVMAKEELKAAVLHVGTAFQSARKDSEAGIRLKREFDLIMARLHIFARVEKARNE